MTTSTLQQRRKNLFRRKNTRRKSEFEQMQTWFPDRPSILAEGDSWFAYPAKWLIGKPPNLVSVISAWSARKANFYTMAGNGDEAVDMVSGKEKHRLVACLKWHLKTANRKPIDLLLFSGGGNDLVGENDFERFIRPYQFGFSARNCIRIRRLSRKIKQIGLAYEELLDIRDHYSPVTRVVTHTYDYPFASLEGANFLGGLIKTKGWMKRFMDTAQIPDALQTRVIRELIDMLAEQLLGIAAVRENFTAVDTRGTLLDRADWLNEIHPDKAGFKAIADKIYQQLESDFPPLRRI